MVQYQKRYSTKKGTVPKRGSSKRGTVPKIGTLLQRGTLLKRGTLPLERHTTKRGTVPKEVQYPKRGTVPNRGTVPKRGSRYSTEALYRGMRQQYLHKTKKKRFQSHLGVRAPAISLETDWRSRQIVGLTLKPRWNEQSHTVYCCRPRNEKTMPTHTNKRMLGRYW